MKKAVFIFALLTIALFSLSAGNPLGLRQPVYPGTVPYWLEFDNDAMGLEIDGEWDDKSTFGFRGGAGIPDWRLLTSLSYTGYTSRGDDNRGPTRFDKLDLGFAWRAESFSVGNWQLDLIPGGGVEILGDMGGYELQSAWHEVIGVDRPIPGEDSYIEAESGTVDGGAFGFTEMQLTHDTLRWFHIDSALRGETVGVLLFNAGISAGLTTVEKTQRISLLYQDDIFSRKESPFPTAAIKEDLRFELELRAGGLYVEKATTFFEEQMEGNIGFIFGAPSLDKSRVSRGMTERMDIGCSLRRQSPLVRWSWEMSSLGWVPVETERLWLTLQYQSGWQDGDEKGDDLAERFSSLSFGLETHFFLNPDFRIDPYGSLAAGLSDFRILKAALEVAETEDKEFFLHLSPILGVRIEFPSRSPVLNYSFALEGGALFKINGDPDVFPVVRFLLGCRLY